MDIRITVFFFALGTAIHIRRPRSKYFSDVSFDAGPEEVTAMREELAMKIHEEIQSGFPLVERSPEPLHPRVVSVRDRGSTNPCEADFLMNGLLHQYGFGARAMAVVDELQVAVLLNKSVSICDGISGRQAIHWNRYFVNHGFGVCSDLEVCDAKKTGAASVGARMSVELRKQSPDNAVPLTRMKQLLYRQLFTLNTETLSIAANVLQDAGLSRDLRYVGVHIRRGDKTVTQNLPIALWANAVAEELERRSLSVVFVASDDEHAGDELASELTATKFGLRSRPTIIQLYSNRSAFRRYDDSDGFLPLLTDVAALINSDVYVGSHFSFTGRLAYFLRDPQADSRSVTGDGNWLKGRLL